MRWHGLSHWKVQGGGDQLRCRVCGGSRVKQFLDLGEQPLANRLLSREDLERLEPKYPLGLEYCKECSFVQLTYVVPPAEMFSDNPYATGASSETRAHFGKMALDVLQACGLVPNGSFVVDVGSNDGTLLRAFQEQGATVLGIEPSRNLVEIANGVGVPTLNAYFDDSALRMATRRHGQADVITACNVFTHSDDVRGFLCTTKALLKPEGTLVLESYYLWDFLRNGAFDQVYHEHLSYFDLYTLGVLLEREGLAVWHVDRVPVQGGSLRVYISRTGVHEKDISVDFLVRGEPRREDVSMKLEDFAGRGQETREQVRAFFNAAKTAGVRVAGYAAAAKAATLLNYCGITRDQLGFIVDRNPMKQGKYLPGVHVPIVGPERLEADPPQRLLVFSWNLAQEIVAEWRHLKKKGTRFFVPLPEFMEVA